MAHSKKTYNGKAKYLIFGGDQNLVVFNVVSGSVATFGRHDFLWESDVSFLSYEAVSDAKGERRVKTLALLVVQQRRLGVRRRQNEGHEGAASEDGRRQKLCYRQTTRCRY